MTILLNAPCYGVGFKLIMGPPGTGKTTLISMLAELYLGAPGVAVLVLAGSNGRTDRSFESLEKWMRTNKGLDDRLCPLQAHTKYVEFKYLMSVLDLVGTRAQLQVAQKKAAPVLDGSNDPPQRLFYERQQQAEKQKHMSDPGSVVAAVVLKAMQDGQHPAAPTFK